jgi:hypothetical protein
MVLYEVGETSELLVSSLSLLLPEALALRNERPLGPTPRKTAATCTATITRENAQNPEPM